MTGPQFDLGRVVATPGALALLEEAGVTASSLIDRHIAGDWGDLCKTDARMNDKALKNGDDRIFSVYEVGDGIKRKVYVITEHDRSTTTVLRPEDY